MPFEEAFARPWVAGGPLPPGTYPVKAQIMAPAANERLDVFEWNMTEARIKA
jgi:hypothetical protein